MTSEVVPRRSSIILAALAFDDTAPHVLREAAELADRRASEVHLVHVVPEEGPATGGELAVLERRLADAPNTIRNYVEQIWATSPRRIVAHLRAGSPSRSILQTAVDIDADVVVVGTHQKRGMQKLITGSVSEEVLRHAHCPVLVAVPKDYSGKEHSDIITPPCPKCVAARQQSNGSMFWCEQHSHAYARPHVYEPADHQRASSIMPTSY
jgi:nucleotide-binding universal stress UspA family protein